MVDPYPVTKEVLASGLQCRVEWGKRRENTLLVRAAEMRDAIVRGILGASYLMGLIPCPSFAKVV